MKEEKRREEKKKKKKRAPDILLDINTGQVQSFVLGCHVLLGYSGGQTNENSAWRYSNRTDGYLGTKPLSVERRTSQGTG